MHAALRDLKHATKSLLRDRGAAFVAVVCLALGLGTLTVTLELVDALLFRPPAGIETPAGLHRLYLTQRQEGVEKIISTLPYPAIASLKEADLFEGGITSYFSAQLPVEEGGRVESVPGLFVGQNYFDIVTLRPRWGRAFSEDESNIRKAMPVVVLTHHIARRFFRDAEQALGESIRIGHASFKIIGVLPPAFQGFDLDRVDLILPMGTAAVLTLSPGWYESANAWFLNVLAREDDDLGKGQQTRAVRVLEQDLGEPYGVSFGPIQAVKRPDSRIGTTLILGLALISGIVLLIASFNVASWFLARHLRRRREMGVRIALGAGTRELWRLALAESFVVTATASLLGVGVTLIESRLLRRLILSESGNFSNPSLGTLGIVLVGLTAAVTLLCGVVPALRLRKQDVKRLLASGGKQGGQGRLEEMLLILQVAFATLSIIAVGWFVASLMEIRNLDLGIEPNKVVVAEIDMERGQPAHLATSLYQKASERAEALPGVEAVALAAGIPLSSSFGVGVSLPGREIPELETGGPYVNAVSENFFRTLGTSVTRGRPLIREDNSPDAEPVVVINQTMARYFYPGKEPLGQCLGVGETACARVVGVVEDARRSGLREQPTFQLYMPFAQAPEWMGRPKALFVRTSAGYDAGALREVLATLAGERLIAIQRLSGFLERDLRPFKLGTSLLSVLASLALILVVLAIYAASSRVVTYRFQEIGVRRALGAMHLGVVGFLGKKLLRFVIPGMVLGIVLALTLGRFAEPLLFEVSAGDLRVIFMTVLLLGLVVVLAGVRPALRALKVAPTEALSIG